MKDVLQVFRWAHERGDANIIDRIIVRALPELLKSGIQLSAEDIAHSDSIMVSDDLYERIEVVAESLIEDDTAGGEKHV